MSWMIMNRVEVVHCNLEHVNEIDSEGMRSAMKKFVRNFRNYSASQNYFSEGINGFPQKACINTSKIF